jgi:hypothetical protein
VLGAPRKEDFSAGPTTERRGEAGLVKHGDRQILGEPERTRVRRFAIVIE